MPAPSLPTLSQWRAYFKSRGIDDETTKIYVSYIRPITKKNVPVIFDREHLAKLLGRTTGFLAKASMAPASFYRKFEIPKRKGGTRSISSPYRSLLECQQWVNEKILSVLPIHQSATGYIRGQSIKDHAIPHLGHKEVLTVDLRDFFPSISLPRVIAVFRDIGYTSEVSLTLAKLCCLDNKLPQGAATSPALCNIICRRFDSRIARLSAKANLSYTRYADDLCFSGEHIPKTFLISLARIADTDGFKINHEKTRKHSATSNLKVVTGLNVASHSLRLLKKFKRDICLDLYHIETHGLMSHLAKRKIHDPTYLSSLLGKVGYWLFIEPENANAQRYRQLLLEHMTNQN